MKVRVGDLNLSSREEFVRIVGPFFENSRWVAERTFDKTPFESREHLHAKLCETMYAASDDKKMQLIQSHPDLVGKMALAGQLTAESKDEQVSAGLDQLDADEVEKFNRFNAAYRERFGFPFIICARQNKKDAILSAFPVRLTHTRDEEIDIALQEIMKIAHLRLLDALSES